MVHRGQGVQVIYGPSVTVIKADLEDYLEHAPKELYEPQKDTESTGQNASEDATIEDKAGEKKVVDTIVISSPITGLAADLSTSEIDYRNSSDFADTEAGRWVAEHAHEFGFILRYPQDKTEITGYSYEPWHIRYVGLTAAEDIYENGLALEEYLEQLDL